MEFTIRAESPVYRWRESPEDWRGRGDWTGSCVLGLWTGLTTSRARADKVLQRQSVGPPRAPARFVSRRAERV